MQIAGRPVKSVPLPISDTVNITRVLPIVDSEIFQRLRYRLQLGEVHVAYPGATHRRFEHCLCVGKLTWRRSRRWLEWNQIDNQDAIDLETYGFLHDIGHGPRSHITDPLVHIGHDERGISLIRELAPHIEQSGANVERIISMMRREDPLAQAVMHTPLGTDKLDYLARDAFHAGLEGRPDAGLFLDNTYYLNNQLVADVKIYDYVKLLMQFYWTMYSRVYYRTQVVTSERYIQRMIATMLGKTGGEPEFTEDELVNMTDSDLDYHLSHSQNPVIQDQYRIYMRRGQPIPAIIFQLEPFHEHNWRGSHAMLHCRAPESVLLTSILQDPMVVDTIERRIEQWANLPENSVLLAPPRSVRRFEPQEIMFLTDSGVVSLETMDPELWAAQRLQANRYVHCYVATYRDYCQTLSTAAAANKILQIIEACVQA